MTDAVTKQGAKTLDRFRSSLPFFRTTKTEAGLHRYTCTRMGCLGSFLTEEPLAGPTAPCVVCMKVSRT